MDYPLEDHTTEQNHTDYQKHHSHFLQHQKDRSASNRSNKSNSHHSSKSHKKKRVIKRKGGLSNVPIDKILKYFNHLKICRANTISNLEWKLSIKQFSRIINSDPILRMNWEYGIYQCQKTLPGKTGKDVLDMIDTAVKSPPSFSNEELVGFPINSIFIEFMQNENGRHFFSSSKINKALKAILQDYDSMLESQASLLYMNEESPSGWFCPDAWKQIDYSQYACDPKKPHYGFKCWNQWFLRQFKELERPIGAGSPNGVKEDNIIVNACQSTPLTSPRQPSHGIKLMDNFWLKDDVYSLVDMFGADQYDKHHLALHFQGGTIYQAFLSALFYHRWNSPVDGVIEDIYSIEGTYYLDQSQFIPFDEGSPNNSQSFLTAVATRQIFIIRAKNKKIGKIAIIFIGMAEVSSCVATVKIGDKVKKGDQLGHFAYGGSSHAIIFEKKVKLNFAPTFYKTEENGELVSLRQNVHSFLAEVREE